ncbi:nitrile hydratase b-subunit() [Amycolatopsis camponoti]|uniref:Nitrile hydratase b-subunit( ) n=1 Tax=Amycolatopsis camponoti TaxID=2606593 RepID=A0A6I8LPL4_9PSEU|nr:nitrile hydratase accessory protein [Amycolatopsis camponoti]VVJ17466.1 nitrile hydratase b-subunit() [Amycolatopsis camponoti]
MSATTTLPAPYSSAAALGETRREVEQLVCGMPGGDPGFEHPWEIRAFAMAVTAHRRLGFDWSEFQGALIASIQDWESSDAPWSYYRHWVSALEVVMAKAGVLDAAALDVQTEEVLALPANRNHHEAHTEPIAVDPARTVPA